MKQRFICYLLFYYTWTKLKNIHTHTHTHIYAHTYAHTQVRSFAVRRKFKASTLLLSRNFNWGNVRSQAETSLSLLHTDQFTSSQQQINSPVPSNNIDLFVSLAFSWVGQLIWTLRISGLLDFLFPRGRWKPPGLLVATLRDVTGEPLVICSFFVIWWRS